ncbi:MAG: RraA family protein [Dethiosulfatibacter sp.]|nr:RraA family protein [Dethiosulfatibacter sp.]
MTRSIGFRIFTNIERPDVELVNQFKGIPSSNINDEMNRLYCMNSSIRPLNHIPLLGTAITVKAPIGDNLIFHKALDIAQPGDVIVVDGAGACDRSLAGEIMFTYALKRGIKGIVVDGAVRDLDGIRKLGLSVYAKAITPQGPYKNGPGEINVPICCGGMVVFPGDIIVGDQDGIVVIRPEDAVEILDKAKKKLEKETIKLKKYETEGIDEQEHIIRIDNELEAKKIFYF